MASYNFVIWIRSLYHSGNLNRSSDGLSSLTESNPAVYSSDSKHSDESVYFSVF